MTFLVNLMFCRLDKYERLIFGWRIDGRAYIRDINWVTYLRGGGVVGLIYGVRIKRVLW